MPMTRPTGMPFADDSPGRLLPRTLGRRMQVFMGICTHFNVAFSAL